MALIGTLVDALSASDPTLWDYGQGGTYSGSTLHVAASNTYPQVESLATYSLLGSAIFVKVTPASGGVNPETALVLASVTEGVDIAMFYSGGNLNMQIRGYGGDGLFADSHAASVAFNGTSMLLWKIAESGGNVTFQTSPDGTTWTTRSTRQTPTFANAVRAILAADNTSGTSTDSIWSNVNTTSGGGSNTGGTPTGNPAVSTLTDPFTSYNAALWHEQVAGDVTFGSGVASIVADQSGFPDIDSVTTYSGIGVALSVKMLPPSGGTGVQSSLGVSSVTAGTDVRWTYKASDSKIHAQANVGFADAGETAITYDPAQHIFFRLSESGGILSWDTSADGTTWTSRRTIVTPAWWGTIKVFLSATATVTGTVPARFSNLNGSTTVVTPPTGGGGTPATFPLAETIADPFTSSTIDQTKWTVLGAVTVDAAGRVVIPTGTSLTSVGQFMLRGSHYSAELAQGAFGTAGDQSSFIVSSGVAGSDLRMVVNASATGGSNGQLVAVDNSGGADVSSSVATSIDLTQPIYVRISEASGTVNFEYTQGSFTFSVLRSVPTPSWVDTTRLTLTTSTAGASSTPIPTGGYSQPVMAEPTTGFAALTANAASKIASVQPWYVGICESEFDWRVDTSAQMKALQATLDARFVRFPVAWRTSKATTGASGGDGTMNARTVADAYRAMGFRMLVPLDGRTGDWDIAAGDVTNIVNAMGTDSIIFTGSNEPDNGGHSITEVVSQTTTDSNELKALQAAGRMAGPVLASMDTAGSKHADLVTFLNALGSGRVQAADWHHYAMGNTYLAFAAAMTDAAAFEGLVAASNTALTAAGVQALTIVSELNYAWQYSIPGHGNTTEFFSAENTLWIASSIGHILNKGGAALPYASQVGPLGIWVDSQSVTTTTSGKPQGTPMPALWGIAAFTGAKSFSHFKDSVYATTSNNANVEVFALNNEAGGINLVLINKDTAASHDVKVTLSGATMNGYDAFQTVRANPYDAPVKILSNVAVVSSKVWMTLPACTVTTVVLK